MVISCRTKTASQRASPLFLQYLALEGLDDKVGDDTAIVARHARTVGVEDARNTDVDAVLALVAVRQGFCGRDELK